MVPTVQRNTKTHSTRIGRTLLVHLMMTTGLMALPLGTALPVLAQQADETVAFAIPAQPLPAALTSFIRRSGWQISYSSDLVRGKRSAAVNGTMSASAALQQLVAGTGISVRISGPRSAALYDPAAQAAAVGGDGTLLEQLTVNNEDTGYVATDTVTATKTDTPLVKVPQSVSVITEKELKDRQVTDLNDIVAYTPGVRAVDYPGGQGIGAIFYMRGFRHQSQRAFYLDGLRNGYNPYDSNLEPYGLEQVNVLRGPSSVLYGDALPGGLVDMRTKRPPSEPLHELGVEYGSNNRRQVTGDFGGPIDAEGKFSYRLTVLHRESDTQVDHSPDDMLYIAPAFTWTPNDATQVTLLAQYQKWTTGGSEQSLPWDSAIGGTAAPIPTDLYLGVPGLTEWNGETKSVGYQFEHQFDNGWTFRNGARYTHTELDYISSWTDPVTLVSNRYLNVYLQDRPRDSDSFSIDSNLSKDFQFGQMDHKVLLGAGFGYSRIWESRTNSSNALALDINNPDYSSYTPNWCYLGVYCRPWFDKTLFVKQFGVYAQDQVDWNNFTLTLSGRYDWVENKTENYASRTLSGLLGASDAVDTVQDQAFTYRAGLAYSFDNGITPYASFSTSFEPQAGTAYNGSDFEPTTGQQFETGLRFKPDWWNGLFSASHFHITQQNVTSSDPDHSGYSVQTGEVQSQGFELEASGELGYGFNLHASYTYTDARVTKDNTNANGVNKTGTRVQAVPYNTASVWLNYDFQIPALEGLSVGAGVRYVDSSLTFVDTSTGAQLEVPDYTLLDASLSYDFGARMPQLAGLSLTLSGTNLTDEDYYSPGFYSNSVIAGRGRTVKAKLNYRW